jgi:hypothetical protein
VTRRALLTEHDRLEFIDQYTDRYAEDPTWFERMKIRRQIWFERACQRYDLIGFKQVADWRADVANSTPRDKTFRILLDGVMHGEFGTGNKLDILYMPDDTSRRPPGGFPLRVWRGNVFTFPDFARDFYAPRSLVRRWFQARKFDLPPWLAEAPANAAVAANPKRDQAKPQRLPKAKIVPEFERWRKGQPEDYIPTQAQDTAHMKQFGVGRDAVRNLRKAYPRRPPGKPKAT